MIQRACFLLLLLSPSAAWALPRSARLLERGANPSKLTLVAQVEGSPPFLSTPDIELTPDDAALVDPELLPRGTGMLISGAVLMAVGANSLALGAIYLVGGLATRSFASTGSVTLTQIGTVLGLAGAGLLGTGAYLFFRGKAQRAAYNDAVEARAVEGFTASYDPVQRSGYFGYATSF